MVPPPGSDGFHVAINNGGANKLDAYLDRSISYRATYDPATAVVSGTIDVTLRNNGPSEGLPDGVIGNYVGLPIGTNRAFINVYTTIRASRFFVDGEETGVEPDLEEGWHSVMIPVNIPSGEERTFTLEFEGQLIITSPDDPTVRAAA